MKHLQPIVLVLLGALGASVVFYSLWSGVPYEEVRLLNLFSGGVVGFASAKIWMGLSP